MDILSCRIFANLLLRVFLLILLTRCAGGTVQSTGFETTKNGNVNQTTAPASAGNPNALPTPPPVNDNNQPLPSEGPLDFGPNVLIFDPTMNMNTIQSQISAIFTQQQTNQFGTARYAYLFKPGSYNLTVDIGFYMTVLGLGASPDDVTITGAVRSLATWNQGNATDNFWRGAENLAVVPQTDPTVDNGTTSPTMVWAVAQATALRRLHVKGKLHLWQLLGPNYNGDWSSGGFIADSLIDTQIVSGSQQQFLTRNTALTNWQGSNWNMVFVGDTQAPASTWGPATSNHYTVIANTPVVREKPYLIVDNSNNYSVVVPSLKTNSQGPSWTSGQSANTTLPISQFYVAHADKDTADTINIALKRGFNLLLTPGIYNLSSAIQVNRANTVVLGIGMATLLPTSTAPAMIVADVDGVTVAGVLFDAGANNPPTMLALGLAPTSVSHTSNPTAVMDIACRVGGASTTATSTQSCMVVNSANVIIDNVWLWRADHGNHVGWTANTAQNGLIVNGANVSAYGLFVEHFQGYQTIWNENGGRVYFYQSEIPYDVPNQASWIAPDGQDGFSSYWVANQVTSHDAQGLGVYAVFNNPVTLNNAIWFPASSSVHFQHMVTQFLGPSSVNASVNYIYNNTGAAVNDTNMSAYSSD